MKKRISCLMAAILVFTMIFCVAPRSAFAVTVGQQLTAPESGWQRIDDANSNINYSNSATLNYSTLYNGSDHYLYPIGSSDVTVSFKFYGTKLRLISSSSQYYLTNAAIQIDNLPKETFSEQLSTSSSYQLVAYEKLGLPASMHSVNITFPANSTLAYCLDAVDIDDTGYLISSNTVTDLNATSLDSNVNLNWSAISGVTSYNIKRSTTAGGPYTTIASGVTNTSYTDSNVTNGTTYYYVVTAVSPSDESPNSNEVSAVPTNMAPSNLTATAGDASVNLSWSAVNGATSYNIKRSTTSGGTYTTAANNITGTTYTDTTAIDGTTYYYVVTAVVNSIESGNSNEVSATPQRTETGDALLDISLSNGTVKEFDVSMQEVDSFISWYSGREDGKGNPYYIFNVNYNLGSYLSVKDYISYSKIDDFVVKQYK